jgi:FkbM family methyltransferase
MFSKFDSSFDKRLQILNKVLQDLGFNNSKDFCASGEMYFIEKYISKFPSSICLDIGANRGDYSRMLLTGTKHLVAGIEPLPSMKIHLSILEQDYPNRFTHHDVAISDSEGEREIYFAESRSAHASFIQEMNELHYINNTSHLTVRTFTLSHLMNQITKESILKIVLVKIDTEGFEYAILKGAEAQLEAMKIPFIQIEYGLSQLIAGVTLLDFHKLLPHYVIYRLTPNSLLRVDPYHPISNLYYFSNYVFVHPTISHLID